MSYLIKFNLSTKKHSEFGNSIVVRGDEIAAIVQGKYEESGWDHKAVNYGVLFLKGNPNPLYLLTPYEEALTTWIKSVNIQGRDLANELP